MAKSKNKPIEEPKVEEMVEEVVEEAVEEVAEPTANDKEYDAFIARTLRAINKMEDPVKAARLANRLLRKRR